MFDWWRRIRGRRPAAANLPLGETAFVVLDTELTGLDTRKDDIVSLGALRMLGGRILLGGAFQELVNPRAAMDGRSVVIHGILPSQLEEMPGIEGLLASFMDYVEGAVLVGHCLSIDLAFLDREAKKQCGETFRNPAVDTLSLYGWLRQRHTGHPAFGTPLAGLTLFDLAGAFGIPVEAAHTALGDAFVTAQLFQRFLPLLAEAGVTDLDGLLRAGDPTRQVERLANPGGHAHF
jgi:DNA polymerase III subunit epsilon